MHYQWQLRKTPTFREDDIFKDLDSADKELLFGMPTRFNQEFNMHLQEFHNLRKHLKLLIANFIIWFGCIYMTEMESYMEPVEDQERVRKHKIARLSYGRGNSERKIRRCSSVTF